MKERLIEAVGGRFTAKTDNAAWLSWITLLLNQGERHSLYYVSALRMARWQLVHNSLGLLIMMSWYMATEIFNLLGLGAKSGIDSHRHPKERRRLRNKKKEQCPRRNPRHAYHTDISKTSCYNEDLQIKKKKKCTHASGWESISFRL